MRIVVSGSFRKQLAEIQRIILAFEAVGIEVLSPAVARVVEMVGEFALLESDTIRDPVELERRHLEAIAEADALYVCNLGGYIGDSVKFELGWAKALGKPVFCLEPVDEVILQSFCGVPATVEEVKKILEQRQPLEAIGEKASVTQLQAYVRAAVIRRGFEDETPQDVLMLLVEEVGEVAKALRKYIGLKTDQAKNTTSSLEEELADVFILLLDLSNRLQVSLVQAFLAKEEQNEKRVWK